MDPSTIFLNAKPRRHRKRRYFSTSSTPVEPLELVAATLQVTEWVDLTFSRAVSLVGGVGDSSVVRVFDGDVGFDYVGTDSMVVISPTVIRVMLTGVGEWTEPGVTLDVAAGSGIVGAADGAAWAGGEGIELPFP